MSKPVLVQSTADAAERAKALDASRSVLVEAPAGSGKTNLLTRRFLRLLAEVDDPAEIVAITFTNAAAAEMRHRILRELERAAAGEAGEAEAEDSMEVLAARALARSREQGWNLVELSAQLRILTIDAFCRELALKQPLLNDFGGGLEIYENPKDLYRRAARRTLEQLDGRDEEVRSAIRTLLNLRDNNWQQMEDLLMRMLEQRDRWMQGFVFDRGLDPDALREKLERPFARTVRVKLERLGALLDQVPHARQEALELARFACGNLDGAQFRELAEMAEFPVTSFANADQLEEARVACSCLANLLLTSERFRKQVDKRHGFPTNAKIEKGRLLTLIADLAKVPDFELELATVPGLPPARYTEEDWAIVRACFVLLRQAAGQLKVVFAEAGAVDYNEVAQTAMLVLRDEEGNPAEGALAVADDIHHLLVDEFQDTSRRQHELVSHLISAWSEREGRTCFVVGDPMQSIYFFRDADAELFPQVRDSGLKIPGDFEPFRFDAAALRTNFRTKESLVARLNDMFGAIFAVDDGSGVRFARAESPQSLAGPKLVDATPRFELHCEFMPAPPMGKSSGRQEQIVAERKAAHANQMAEMIALIRSHEARMNAARLAGLEYRIAILGRARTALVPIAEALREEKIPFRAIDLEGLKERPEVMDALAILKALLNPQDRVAWLGLLRAPWCGLSLKDLHTLASADDSELQRRPVRELIGERASMLTELGSIAANRVLGVIKSAEAWRAARPAMTLGTWVGETWLRLGGAACVDAAQRANVELLWQCLDGLPEGDADAFGFALDAALDKLTAQPDPRASGECGVQLMTIHKAKGLEFEVVIVPELQAGTGRGKNELLSWMERGLAAPGEMDEVTEFLVAPIQFKGTEPGKTRKWIEAEYRRRERQEARRILYVASTRARDELHFFARPEFKLAADGVKILCNPKDSLLKTAWPALREDVERQFEAWSSAERVEPGVVEEIAASDADSAQKNAILKRLPAEYKPAAWTDSNSSPEAISGLSAEPLYQRHEGGLESRALGVAVHAIFEQLAQLGASRDWEPTRKAIEQLKPRLVAEARSAGLDLDKAMRVAAEAVEIALDASRDATAQWILSPHPGSASEIRWASVDHGNVHGVQADRIFRAGPEPGVDGDAVWWIVDYKTAYTDGVNTKNVLLELREVFAPQLEAYARVLRGLHGADAVIRAGLYYPRMKEFDWWEA